MKLIHRLELEVSSKEDVHATAVKVTASWYRPFLDSGYQAMIAKMIDSGCFDGFMRSIIDQLVQPGERIMLFCTFYGFFAFCF